MNIVLSTYAVRDSAGNIDHDSTVAKFASDLFTFEAERETETAVIATAVHALFDQYKSASLNMPFITNQVLRSLNAQPENFKILETRTLEFLRSNSQGKTDDGGNAERPNSVFVIAKGKGGGVKRRADIPTK